MSIDTKMLADCRVVLCILVNGCRNLLHRQQVRMSIAEIVLDGVSAARCFIVDGFPIRWHILTQFLRDADTGRHLHSFHTGKAAKLRYVTCRQLLPRRFVIKHAIVCSGSPDGEANPIRQVCHSADDVIMDDIHRRADDDHQ